MSSNTQRESVRRTLHRTEAAVARHLRSIQIQPKVIRTSIRVDRIVASITRIQQRASQKMKSIEIWIGRFDVKPKPGNNELGEAIGAIVNVVALATGGDDFIQMVKAAMSDHEFDTLRHDDVARLSDWTKDHRLNGDLESAVKSLTNEYPIQFDEFQSYLRHDA